MNVGNKLVVYFKEAARLLNEFFASKCTSITNDSSLARLVLLNSESSLSAINFNNDDIFKLLDLSTLISLMAMITLSIRMIKICNKTIVKLPSLIYKNCTDTGIFPDLWKKSNIVRFIRKEIKLLQNYRSVSLLPIFGKIIEKSLFNSIFEYLQENNLLCENQSGFQPYDSCEYQLPSIVHKIYVSFNFNTPLDVRAAF